MLLDLADILAVADDLEKVLVADDASFNGWTAERWEALGDSYFDEHDDVGTGPDARGPALLIFDKQPGVWRVRQILDDPAGDRDWGFDVEVDLAASDAAGTPVLTLRGAGRMDQF